MPNHKLPLARVRGFSTGATARAFANRKAGIQICVATWELSRISRYCLCDGRKVQETAATLVLSSEAIHHPVMSDATAIPAAPAAAQSAPILAVPSDSSDEHLMRARRDGSAPQLAAALNELKFSGRVTSEAQSGEEVTSQDADLVARIKNSRETEIRL